MSHEKVNTCYSLTNRRADNAGEGLRLLARIIARHLVMEKLRIDEQRPSGFSTPCLPHALVNEEPGNGIKRVAMGRPRISVDFAIVLRLREEQNLGWSRMAEVYREITGKYISRDTIKRRYLEAIVLKDNASNSTDLRE